MIDKHIYFSLEETLKIKEYAKRKKFSFTVAVRELVKISLDNEEVLNKMDKLDKHMKKYNVVLNNIYMLLEQLYSDLDFENITNPKKSKALNNFKCKLKENKIND